MTKINIKMYLNLKINNQITKTKIKIKANIKY